LKFSFENIELPVDSFGFVKFRLSQKEENSAGDIIENQSEFYPDFNAPTQNNAVTQTVQNEFMFDMMNVNLCWSETFGGIVYTDDAVLFSPISYDSATVISPTYINVYPIFETTIDTAVISGSIVNGVSVFSDTLLIDSLQTDFGCDSILLTNVTLIVGTQNPKIGIEHFSVFPNPTQGYFYINLELKESAKMNWELYNALGEKLQRSENQFFGIEINEKINTSTFSSGLYFLRVQIDEDWVEHRILIQ